jgi:hypothetical protein
MVPLLKGKMEVDELRETGVNTEVIKKFRLNRRVLCRGAEAIGEEITSEIELHDRAGQEFDRIVEKTDGKDRQPVDQNVTIRTYSDALSEARALCDELGLVDGTPLGRHRVNESNREPASKD